MEDHQRRDFSTARYYLQLFISHGIKDRFMILVRNSKGFFLAFDFILMKSSFSVRFMSFDREKKNQESNHIFCQMYAHRCVLPVSFPVDLLLWLELVSKELNQFGVIADLFRQIGVHSTRFVLFCSF